MKRIIFILAIFFTLGITHSAFASIVASQDYGDGDVNVGLLSPQGPFTYTTNIAISSSSVLYLRTFLVDYGTMEDPGNDSIVFHYANPNGTEYIYCQNPFFPGISMPSIGLNEYICNGSSVIPAGSTVTVDWDGTGFKYAVYYGLTATNEPFFQLSDSPVFPDPPEFSMTHIITTDPTASSTVSTSSPVTIGASMFITEDDYVDGDTYLRMSFWNQTSVAYGGVAQGVDMAWSSDLLLDSYGYVSTSTTRDFSLQLGKVQATYQIVVKRSVFFGLFYDYDVLVSSTTYFYVGQKTQFDIDQEAGNLGIFGLGSGEDSQGTSTSILDCNIGLSFQFDKCIRSLIIPNSFLTNQAVSSLISLPVIGWLPRTLQIMYETDATSSLPVISYTFADSNIAFAGVNLHFDPWQYFYTDGAPVKDELVSDSGGGNIWDIMQPIIDTIIYLTLLFVVIKRLSGMDYGSDSVSSGEGTSVSSTTDNFGNTRVRTTHVFRKGRVHRPPRLRQ